jgi:hypothetical protein
MNYILKKIEKKVYINNNLNYIYLILDKNKNYNFYLTPKMKFQLNYKNIFFIKKYLIDSGVIKG